MVSHENCHYIIRLGWFRPTPVNLSTVQCLRQLANHSWGKLRLCRSLMNSSWWPNTAGTNWWTTTIKRNVHVFASDVFVRQGSRTAYWSHLKFDSVVALIFLSKANTFVASYVLFFPNYEYFNFSFINSGYLYRAFSSPQGAPGAPVYSIDTVSELTSRSATGNCECRTFPRSLGGCRSGIQSYDLPDIRHWTYHWGHHATGRSTCPFPYTKLNRHRKNPHTIL